MPIAIGRVKSPYRIILQVKTIELLKIFMHVHASQTPVVPAFS